MKKETQFRAGKVIPFLKKLIGTSYFPIQQQTIRGDADFILCCRGVFVWLELKAHEGAAIAPVQQAKADWVRHTGGVALIASPDNWDSVKLLLNHLNKGD